MARNIALGEMKEASTLRDDPEPSESKSARRRRLTAEQLAHKRELDRRAQRNNREKTRSRIAHLESLVEALQERDHERLVGQLDDQKAEIERLKGLLNSVANLVTGAEGIVPKTKVQRIEDAKTVDDIEQHRDSDSPDESPIKVEEDSPRPANENDLDSAPDVPALPQQPSLVNGNPVPQPVQNVVMRTQHQKESITQMATEIFNQENLEGKMWYICGVILRYILATTSPSQIRIENDEDIAIRAVFDGWSSVVERYPLDRGWQWLKEVDERIYFHRWPPFRLMHLRNCRLIFLRQIFGNTTKWHNPLPAFFTPRPAEENVPHDPLVEYFPWPGLRERMLFRPTMFATNKFMDNLRCEIEFLWGTDPHKLYCVDPIEGKYTYSEWFHERIEDIRFYPGTTDFFNSFPELKSDIPFLSNAVTSLKIGYTDDDKDISKGRRESLQSSRTLSELGHGLGV